MALYNFLCGVTVIILFYSDGCHTDIPSCGKVMDGQDLDEHLPWHVVITVKGYPICSGSLISKSWVLTDGHCGFGPEHDANVKLGLSDDPQDPFGETRVVDYVTCSQTPPDSFVVKDGLCLLRMNTPVEFTSSISPICLALNGSTFHSGMDSYVATRTPGAARVKVPIVGYKKCDCFLPRLKMNMICAGHKENWDMLEECLENLGGGLFAYTGGSWTLIGVGSLDQRCPQIGTLQAYTRVSVYQDWIMGATGKCQPGFSPLCTAGDDSDGNFVCPKDQPPAPCTSSSKTPVCPKAPTCPKAPVCPNAPVWPRHSDVRDGSVFGGAAKKMASSTFILVCVLGLSLYITY